MKEFMHQHKCLKAEADQLMVFQQAPLMDFNRMCTVNKSTNRLYFCQFFMVWSKIPALDGQKVINK